MFSFGSYKISYFFNQRKKISIKEYNGITYFCFDNFTTTTIFELSHIKDLEELTEKFFDIGALLKKSINDTKNYTPKYMDIEIEKEEMKQFSTKRPIDKVEYSMKFFTDVFSDDKCPFLSKLDYKNKIIQSIFDFINEYGFLFSFKEMPHSKLLTDLKTSLMSDENNKIFFDTNVFPVSLLAYYIFEIYYKYYFPQKYMNGEFGTLNEINLKITTIYEDYIDDYYNSTEISSLMDLISIFLFTNKLKMKECVYCGRSFLTTNKKAIYCSPVCRNRANVKKNYYKKKKLFEEGE